MTRRELFPDSVYLFKMLRIFYASNPSEKRQRDQSSLPDRRAVPQPRNNISPAAAFVIDSESL